MSFDYTLKNVPAMPSRHIDYAAELNAEQLAAATAKPGPVLVIAGAGSGKTRTLTYRVAYLIEHGVAPENILLLTFTNKAAKEMLERVSNLIPHDLSRLWGGTFHHVGNKILRRHAELVELTKDFSILDRDDSASLIKTCYEQIGIKSADKRFPKPDVVLDLLSFASNTERTLEDLFKSNYEHLSEFSEKIIELCKIYHRRKKETNAADFDDLLVLPLQICRENPAVLERYQDQFQHILVDEYQDTNSIQSEFIDLLGAKHHRIMAVGDDAQSIYSWRGANFANIMSFPDRHPETQIIHLETNYRSIPEILTLANTTIAQNANQFPKNLRATRTGGVKPALVTLHDSRQQALFIAQRSLELMEEGVNLSEIAVLYRSHFHSMELQMELTRRNIPFSITSGIRFFEQAHIKDVAAYLRLLVNPHDEVSFKRLALLLPGVGAKTAAKMWGDYTGGRTWEDVRVPEKARAAWTQWGELDKQLREQDVMFAPAALIKIIVESYYEDYLKLTYANYSNRLDDLQQLKNFAGGFEETADFLSQLSLMTNMEVDDDVNRDARPTEAIRLSTVHQAKGLEFKAVFVIMLCEGLFPSNKSMITKEGEEEERRLFYVAVTRAKDELYLTYPRIRTLANQGDLYQSPSRFLDEFPREMCNVWKIQPSHGYFGEHSERDKFSSAGDEPF